MSADEYKLRPEEFPPDDVMERAARGCVNLARCESRPFSFCLKRCAVIDGDLFYHKVTYKHCWECINDIS